MKRTLAILAILSLSLIPARNARAGDDDGDHHSQCQTDNSGQGEDCQGGDIEGSESLFATVVLVATNDAPSDAGGTARLISANNCGTVVSSFSLCVTGLDAATYDLSVVRKSDGSIVDLGQFTVGAPCRPGSTNEDDEEGDDQNEDHG